jgi:osmoprotectant transport system permease protein
MFVHNVIKFFTTSANWSGPEGIPARVVQHIGLSATSLGIALLVAIPIGMYIGHFRRAEFITVTIANLGRSIPSFAILSLVYGLMLGFTSTQKLAFGFTPTVVALTLLGIPAILTNTYVGVQGVDPDIVEAARGMGMSGRQVLSRIELPLAAPLIVAGVRTAAVQIVATATLSALIAGGGLGRFIVDGFDRGDTPMAVAGAALVAVLAIFTEILFGAIERVITPKTRSGKRSTLGTAFQSRMTQAT